MKKKEILELIHDVEGWQVQKRDGREIIELYGQDFPVVHPISIWQKIYRTTQNPQLKYEALVKAHHYHFPDLTYWNHWTERRFREHCERSHSVISWAGGSSIGKSFDAAQLGYEFWTADPENRGVIIASTTLEAMESRVWGYLKTFIKSSQIALPIRYVKSKPPKVLFVGKNKNPVNIEGRQGTDNIDDTIHGIFAAAAKRGDDREAINTWIGRHPKRGLMVILDECPDLPVAIMGAIPNLEAQQETFQVLGLGNSADKYDLHGSLSTPKDGWDSVNPDIYRWETTQKNGVCLYFNPWDSPAIIEPDEARRKTLSKIFPTEDALLEKQKKYGETSDAYYRFVLGFWRKESTDNVVISDSLIKVFSVDKKGTWSGLQPLKMVAGLDPAFSTGGDQCILRLAILGHDTRGKMILDFRNKELLFKIKIDAKAGANNPAELQIAQQVIDILGKYRVTLDSLAIDSTGQGRALSEVIRLYAKSIFFPIKIYSTSQGSKKQKSFDVTIKTAYEMWMDVRDFIQNDQVRGLDQTAITQFATRLVETRMGKPMLETKKDYKSRMTAIHASWGSSPDEADAAALVVQTAMMKHGFRPGQIVEIPEYEDPYAKKIAIHMGNQAVQETSVRVVSPPTASFTGTLESMAALRKPF